MDMYSAGTVQVLYPLDRPYAPYRSEEDAYYDSNAGLELPNWLTGIIHILGGLAQHRETAQPAPAHTAQTA